jgi:transcriptional regulator with XRE-family HTH domain
MRERITKSTEICADVFEGSYTHPHSRHMDDLPLLLRKMKEAMGGNQAALAARLGDGITQPQVSRWLKGAEPKRPHFQRILALAHELGITTQISLSSESMPEPDLNLIVHKLDRLVTEVASMRDDVGVLTAIVMRLDGSQSALLQELRATHSQIARMNDRIRKLENSET